MTLSGKRKVCITGFCDTSRNLTPYDDPEYEVWGLNRGYIFMPRADRWFDLHSPEIRRWQHRRPGKHMEWLQSFKGQVYLHAPDPDLPNATVYPLQEVADDLGGFVHRIKPETDGLHRWDTKGEPYLSSSIALEIALAIYEGFEEIMLVGVDLNTASEYAWQKPGVEYLIGVAAGRGITVVLPDNCPLLKGDIYGRGFLKQEGETLTYTQYEERLKALKTQLDAMNRQHAELIGGKREVQWLLDQMVPGVDHEKIDERRQKFEHEIAKVSQELMIVQGSMKELLHWIHQTPEGQQPEDAINQLLTSANGHLDAGGESSGFPDIDEVTEPILVNAN